MRRRFSTALQRWSSTGSSHSTSLTADLCKNCHSLVLEQHLIRKIPESPLPRGSVALDLLQGYIDLPLKYRDSYPGFPRLKNSASSGCAFCKILFDAIEQDQQDRSHVWEENLDCGDVYVRFRYNCAPELGLQSFNPGQWPTMLSALEALISYPSSANHPITLVFKLHCDEGSDVGNYLRIHGRFIEHSTLSPRNISLMNDWIQDCRRVHDTCRLSTTAAPQCQPTRLVYVGDRSRGLHPCLVTTAQITWPAKYTALSYCWGPASGLRLTTTSKTFANRLDGLPWQNLPLTFRDAFIVNRSLKIDFIWIDSLCIIQDDEHDWQVEAAKMGDIYRNAYVTIVAAASESSNDGFLHRDTPQPSVTIPFRSQVHPEISGHYYVSFAGRSGYKEDFMEEIERSTWNKRGWTFQERLLSPRIIFFSKCQLYFECRTHRRSENYGPVLKRQLALHKLLQQEWRYQLIGWRRLVEQYSRRSFTFEKDRLPALSGLAQDMSSIFRPVDQKEPLQYLAGHWSTGLAADLLWIPQQVSQPINLDQTSYQVPTWSWCSRGGPVSWIEPPGNLCTYCEITPTYLGNSVLICVGGIENILEIKGPLSKRSLNVSQALEDFQGKRKHIAEHIADSRLGIVEVNFDFHLPFKDFKTALDDDVWLALLCYTQSPKELIRFHKNRTYESLACQDVVIFGLVLSRNLPIFNNKLAGRPKARDNESAGDSKRLDFRRIGVFGKRLSELYEEREQYLSREFERKRYRIR